MKLAPFSLFFVFGLESDLEIEIIFKCIIKSSNIHYKNKYNYFDELRYIKSVAVIHIQQPLAFISSGQLGRHLGFLSPHQQWPLFLGRFINSRVWQTFLYITFNVVLCPHPTFNWALKVTLLKEFIRLLGRANVRAWPYIHWPHMY